ncbi:hypothetical protein Bache_0422 [Bacteroides helcogenes P 36-108]|uniref:Uncharacterized protein n=1 Tax=Bacteroides helcogenes (strain ATCC 35417 / DSM 20613 / JCM 6297 / CCUG 15421 / P 36-108) TaxID=693979 RepID=E6SV13_BACT6|nr:hypothetical protein Bache_0422 [Bacteroides helcogenes P 36-108]
MFLCCVFKLNHIAKIRLFAEGCKLKTPFFFMFLPLNVHVFKSLCSPVLIGAYFRPALFFCFSLCVLSLCCIPLASACAYFQELPLG